MIADHAIWASLAVPAEEAPVEGWKLGLSGIASFAMVVALVPMCRRFALARGISDHPAPGKVHKDPTPYLGGVAIKCLPP